MRLGATRNRMPARPRDSDALRPTAASRGSIRQVGVEEELLIVDAETFCPIPVGHEMLAHQRARSSSMGTVLEAEVAREQIEVVAPPQSTAGEVLQAVRVGRRAADHAARAFGARVAALATSPMSCDTHIVESPRYDRMRAEFGLTMREQLTCGFHVHVSIDSTDEGVLVLDRIRPWLPVILALSANSPFWHDADSDFSSYRYQAWGRWPSAGPYDLFGSTGGYAAALEQMLATDVSFDSGMIYFDARLSAHAPTVEVRIADVCLAAEDAVTIALLIRALVERAAHDGIRGVPPDTVPTGVLRLASWRASRSGMTGTLLHPLTHRPCPAAAAVSVLLHHVRGHFPSAAEDLEVRLGLAEILRRGTGAVYQRAAARSGGGSLPAVVAQAIARTHAAPVDEVGPALGSDDFCYFPPTVVKGLSPLR